MGNAEKLAEYIKNGLAVDDIRVKSLLFPIDAIHPSYHLEDPSIECFNDGMVVTVTLKITYKVFK